MRLTWDQKISERNKMMILFGTEKRLLLFVKLSNNDVVFDFNCVVVSQTSSCLNENVKQMLVMSFTHAHLHVKLFRISAIEHWDSTTHCVR